MTQMNGMKNEIMQVTYFLNVPMVNLVFYSHIKLNWEKVTSHENLAAILPLKSRLSGKFQRFISIGGSIEMLEISWMSKNIN